MTPRALRRTNASTKICTRFTGSSRPKKRIVFFSGGFPGTKKSVSIPTGINTVFEKRFVYESGDVQVTA
ncbi:hypothetical protein EBR66_00590 [bacterium]|nr:hypothetical protein [bacterium]